MLTNTQKLIEAFKETLKVGYSYKVKIYKQNQTLSPNNNINIVWSENTVKTFLDFPLDESQLPIAILNFADPFTPGGLVWDGVKTQEEDLCRSSTLYRSLLQAEQDFYEYNKKLNRTTDRIIYSPNVLFFRDDLLQFVDIPRYCNVITCAAPFDSECLSDDLIKNRMKRIIDVAKINNNKTLILGRWGCGAFGNDWNLFKRLWKQVINENYNDGKL